MTVFSVLCRKAEKKEFLCCSCLTRRHSQINVYLLIKLLCRQRASEENSHQIRSELESEILYDPQGGKLWHLNFLTSCLAQKTTELFTYGIWGALCEWGFQRLVWCRCCFQFFKALNNKCRMYFFFFFGGRQSLIPFYAILKISRYCLTHKSFAVIVHCWRLHPNQGRFITSALVYLCLKKTSLKTMLFFFLQISIK